MIEFQAPQLQNKKKKPLFFRPLKTTQHYCWRIEVIFFREMIAFQANKPQNMKKNILFIIKTAMQLEFSLFLR
jgi:hypothetical protein